mmetsp:Transcript_4571/g.9161  ORF Transcript_4571/g.9161 Transcript_4571/m.9161 type:complete len:222 (-) Transcript_4571:964-1629(-)
MRPVTLQPLHLENGVLPTGCRPCNSTVERNYNAGIEDYVVHVQLFATSPEAILAGEDQTLFEATGQTMTGSFVDARGNRREGFDSGRGGHFFNISDLLQRVGLELDVLNTEENAFPIPPSLTNDEYTSAVTYRRTGFTIVLVLKIQNAKTLIFDWPQNFFYQRWDRRIEYEYQVRVVRDYEVSIREEYFVGIQNGISQRVTVKSNGIRIVVIGYGEVGVFS